MSSFESVGSRHVDSLLQALFEVARDGIVVIDTSGTIVRASPAVTGILGYLVEELVDQPVEILMPEPERSQHGGHIERFLKGGAARVIGTGREVEALHKDGSRVWIELSVSELVADDTKFFCGSLRDIAARMRAESEQTAVVRELELANARLAALVSQRTSEAAASEVLLQRALDALSAHIAILDDAWTIVAVNVAWCRFAEQNGGTPYLGRSYAEVLERATAAGAEDAAQVGDALRRVQKGELEEYVHEYPCHSPEKERWFSMRVTRFEGEQGAHLVVAYEDVTARRRAQEQLRHAQTLDALGHLAGAIAHDFNNLLTSIRYHVAFVRDDLPPDGPAAEELAKIDAAANRASELTRQLLTFSKRQVITPVVLDLGALVSAMVPALRRQLESRIALETSISDETGSVEVDRAQMNQVVSNLVLNARDAIHESGRITIRARRELHEGQSWAVLEVEDSGCGMTEETRSRLFEPFFTTKSVGQGAGLGLSAVYGIVTRANGTVSVCPSEGSGTIFCVRLPSAPASQASTTAGSDLPPLLSSMSILIVEDDEMLRKAAARSLRAHSHHVLDVASPAEALAVVSDPAVHLDLVITDVLMPEMTGVELAHRIRALRPELTVLLISGFAADALSDADRELFPLLSKPFSPADLESKVREVLEARAKA